MKSHPVRHRMLSLSLIGSMVLWSVVGMADAGLDCPRLPLPVDVLEVKTVAGPDTDTFEPEPGYVDQPGAAARFNYPTSLVAQWDTRFGTQPYIILVADAGNHSIRRLAAPSPDAWARVEVRTLAGNGEPGDADGPGDQARFHYPMDVTVSHTDAARGWVYVADTFNHRIRRIDPEGHVSTVAGSGAPGYTDGEGWAAEFNTPMGLAYGEVGGEPVLFVTDTENHCVRMIGLSNAGNEVTTLAGLCGEAGYANGPADAARFARPRRLSWRPGSLFVADEGNGALRWIRFEEDGPRVSTIAGGPLESESAINVLSAMVDSRDNVYLVNGQTIGVIRRERRGGYEPQPTLLAGDGTMGYENGCWDTAKFNAPLSAAPYFHTIAVADTYNHTIRLIQPIEQAAIATGRCPSCGPVASPDYR